MLRVSATEVADRQVELSSVFRSSAVAAIETRLAEAGGPAERVEIVRGFLRDRLIQARVDPTLPKAFKRLFECAGDCRTKALARDLGLSERQLERRFAQEIGASPKTVARLIRLHAAVQTRFDGLAWADAAASSGFSDQAHLIREFRRASGRTPTAYVGAAAASQWRFHNEYLRGTPFFNTTFD